MIVNIHLLEIITLILETSQQNMGVLSFILALNQQGPLMPSSSAVSGRLEALALRQMR